MSTFQATGCPDILCCYRGKFVALEAKRDNKHKATRIQEFTIQEILAAGGIALVIWNTEMVTQILDTIDSWK